MRLVVITEVVEHFLPALEIIVELLVIRPSDLAKKHVLDEVNGTQGDTAVVKGCEQGIGVRMAIDGNLDHDCGTHQFADIKQGVNTFDPAPVFNFLAQSIVKIVECLRHLS